MQTNTNVRSLADMTLSAQDIQDVLQGRLASLIDAELTFKHAHWNVRGSGFLAAHELLDRVTKDLRRMADEVAERLAGLGEGSQTASRPASPEQPPIRPTES